MASLVIDNREHDIINLLKLENIKFSTENLDIGDIVLKNNDEIICIIERKTVSDLKASICDGRSKEQKARLMNCGIDLKRIMYLIEGNLSFSPDKNLHGIKVSALLGSIINTQFRDSIKVYKTHNIKETVYFIIKLLNSFTSNYNEYFVDVPNHVSGKDYACTIKKKKKDNITPEVWFINQLSSIPQVSNTISNEIVSKYSSIHKLVLQYEGIADENERENLLSDITYPIKNNKTRRIGSKISSRIYKMIYNKK